jgi:hypothetical protein
MPAWPLDEFDAAYDVFGRAADTGALKVVLSRTAGADHAGAGPGRRPCAHDHPGGAV